MERRIPGSYQLPLTREEIPGEVNHDCDYHDGNPERWLLCVGHLPAPPNKGHVAEQQE